MKKPRFQSLVLLIVFLINLIPMVPVYAATPEASADNLIINAYGNGTVTLSLTKDGGYNIIDCGIDYGTSSSNLNQSVSLGAKAKGTYTVSLTGLSAGTTYYYRAYAINSNDEWTQSSIKSAVLPGSFSISSPSNGASITYGSDVTVKWDSAKYATQYRLVMRDITAGEISSTQIYKGSGTNHTIDADDLTGGHKYKIHVQARSVSGSDDNAIWASNGEEYYFNYSKMSTPSITTPSSNGTMYLSSPMIKWTAITGAKEYWLSIKNSTTGQTIYDPYIVGGETSSINISNYNPSVNLLNKMAIGDKYTITVTAIGPNGHTQKSSSVSFTLKGEAPSFSDYYSENVTSNSFEATGQIITTTNMPISSISDCGFYYRKSGSSSSTKVALGKPNRDTFYTTISGLSPNTTYQFKAYAVNEYGEGTTSWKNVTTTNVVGSTPTVSTVGYSKNSDTEYVIKGKVTDNGNSPITMYGFYIGTDPDNLGGLDCFWEKDISENTEFTYTYKNLQPNTTYYYQAFAYNKYGLAEGGISSFTVGNIAVPEVISANVSPGIMSVGDTATFTVKTNTKATKLIMYTETGAIADEWSGSSYYTDNGDERIWTIEREIYSTGRRFLTFKASDGPYVNDNSSATVSVQVTSAGEKIKATITSQKNQSLTLGESYKATWTTDKTAQSYSLFIYYNGNLIRTIKNYRYQYYDFSPSMLSNQGEYAIEVIPYYPGYEATGDTATITVSPSESSTAVIKSIDSTSEVICNVDNFECTVTTNANTDKVVLEYELGNRTELTLASSTTTEKNWKVSRKLNYIGKRKLTVRAFDSNGKETSPSFVNVDVIPEDINWNLTYNEASGELTIDTSDEISSKLTGAYAKLVVYKNGTDTNLLENSGELALINKGEATSRTWNVFTDLNLVSGETYTFAVSYLSTYAQGFDCSAIIENIGTKTISDTEEELPEIYSVDIEIDEVEQVSLLSEDNSDALSAIGLIYTTLGKTANFSIITSEEIETLYMVPPEHKYDTSKFIPLTPSIEPELISFGFIKRKHWKISHTFTSLHSCREFIFVGESKNGTLSTPFASSKLVYVGYPDGAWEGIVEEPSDVNSNRRFLIISQSANMIDYNDNNTYYLWIKNPITQEKKYYGKGGTYHLVHQNTNNRIVKAWDIENELSKLSPNTTYIYGVSGKSTYCDSADVNSVDYYIGTFTTTDTNLEISYSKKYVASSYPIYLYRSPLEREYNRVPNTNLANGDVVECDEMGTYAEQIENDWIKVKYQYEFEGETYNFAYVKKENISNHYFIWPISNSKADYRESTTTKGIVSSFYGYRKVTTNNGYQSKLHTGIDLGVSIGNEVFATNDGTVTKTVKTNSSKGYGNHIIIKHNDGIETLYAHLKPNGVLVEEGDEVTRGQLIGYSGNTGNTSGPHLHYELRYSGSSINPLTRYHKDDSRYKNGIYNANPIYNIINGSYTYYNNYNATLGNLDTKKEKMNENYSEITLFSIEDVKSGYYQLTCYNKYGELIEIINTNSTDISNITIPYSTEYISFVLKDGNPNEIASISYNGTIIDYGETFIISGDDNIIDINISNMTNIEQADYSISLICATAETGNTITDLLIGDNDKNNGGDVLSYNVDVSDNMEITLPRSTNNIGLSIEVDSPYASTRVFKNGYYWIDSDVILLDDTTNELTIIVENELGEEKEYTLTINKESEYESDTTLESLNVFAYDSADEYIDVYTFDSTVNEITDLSENAKTIMISASATSDFATVTYYINGEETIFDEPLSLSTGFVLTVRITAEDGTYKDYTYTYGEPPVPLTKTTFKNTSTYHKFYVTFEEPIDNATIYAAVYDKDGKLLGLEASPCDGDDYYIVNVPVNSDTKKAKIFVWADNIKPLGYAEILNME